MCLGVSFVPLLPVRIPAPLSTEGAGHWVVPSKEAVPSLEVVGRVILILGIMRSFRLLCPRDRHRHRDRGR